MATYYVRADGTAGNKSAATSDSSASTSMSLATCRSESSGFAAGDVIVISDAGGVYRGSLTIYGGGSSGNHITYQKNSGGTPVIKGSDLITGWSLDTGSIYTATVTTEPEQLWIDGTFGDRKDGTGSMSNEYDWYWGSNTLYLYAPGDPDTEYTTPGVEAGQRNTGIACSQNYLTFDGLTIAHCNTRGADFWGSSNITFQNCILEWCWIHGLAFGSGSNYSDITIEDSVARYNGTTGISFTTSSTAQISDCLLRRNQIYENGKHQGDETLEADHEWTTGIKFFAWNATSNNIIEQNEIYDNGIAESGSKKGHGVWLDFVPASSGNENIIRHNLIYDNQGCAVFLEVTSYCDVVYNVCHGNNLVSGGGDWSSATIRLDTRESYDCDRNRVYNNTLVGGYYGIFASTTPTRGAGDIKNNVFKNNIVSGYSTAALYANYGGDNDGTYGSGNVYESNCFDAESTGFIEWDGTSYDTYDSWISASSQTDNNVEADPAFTNEGGDDYTLSSSSPCIGEGADLGADFDDGLMPSTTWPDGVTTGDQDNS